MELDLTTFEDDPNFGAYSHFPNRVLITLETEYTEFEPATYVIVPFESDMILEDDSETTPQLVIFYPSHYSIAYSPFSFDFVTPEIASKIKAHFNL